MERSITTKELADKLASQSHHQRLSGVDYCRRLARRNIRKAVVIILVGGLLVWSGLLFYPFTGMLEGHLTRIVAGMTAGNVQAIRVALVALGGYLAIEAFLILLQLHYYSKLIPEVGVTDEELVARPL